MRLINYYKRMDEVCKKNHKNTFLTTIDMLIWYIFYGSTLTDYLNYEFYNRSFKERKEYAVVRTQYKFYSLVSPEEYKKDFSVKPNFLRIFKDYIGRDYYTPDMGKDKLKDFLKNKEYYMIKPVDGLGGGGVEKRKVSDKSLDELYDELITNNSFLEEVVVQHHLMNKLSPSSVNTLRVMTYSYGNKSEVIYMALRVGNGINPVDNFHAGGMGVSIDLDKGILVGNAIDKNLNEFERHPFTNTKFDGFKIPYFKEIKDLVINASLKSNNIHVVGWDVCITENGPILIEGNRRPGFDLIQVLAKKGRKDIMRYVLNKYYEDSRNS